VESVCRAIYTKIKREIGYKTFEDIIIIDRIDKNTGKTKGELILEYCKEPRT